MVGPASGARWSLDVRTLKLREDAVFQDGAPIIEKLSLPVVPDRQVRVTMFENGEIDVMSIDAPTHEAALDPDHPFNPLLYIAPYGGLGFTKLKIDMAPLEDPLVRKALAHGQDMETIVKAVWGSTATRAKA